MLKALVMGDASGIPPDVRQAFTRTGTSHILAISGLHISLVATAAFAIFRWGLCRVPWLLRRAWTRKGAALLTLVPVAGYALVAGFSPSTQRALIMVAVFLTAFLVERETDLKNSLALAALAILVVHPPSLFSVSFQLSFAAVFAIVYGMECLNALFPAPPAAGRAVGAHPALGRDVLRGVRLRDLGDAPDLPLLLQPGLRFGAARQLRRHPPDGVSLRGARPGRGSGGCGQRPGRRGVPRGQRRSSWPGRSRSSSGWPACRTRP